MRQPRCEGVVGRVQVSEATYWRTNDVLAFECRGELDIKGKGVMAKSVSPSDLGDVTLQLQGTSRPNGSAL